MIIAVHQFVAGLTCILEFIHWNYVHTFFKSTCHCNSNLL